MSNTRVDRTPRPQAHGRRHRVYARAPLRTHIVGEQENCANLATKFFTARARLVSPPCRSARLVHTAREKE